MSVASRAAAVVAALALAAACGLPAPRLPSSLTAPGTAAPGSIEAFVPAAERFVEGHRGLKFKHAVRVEHLADAAFGARIATLQRADHADLDRQGKVLRALGLVPPGTDVEKAEEALLSSQVIGYYDPDTGSLMVRGTEATASVRHVVVHELTHALQDQWFDLRGHQHNLDDDAAAAYTSLVEGDAVRVEQAYVDGLGDADRRQIDAADGAGPPGWIPAVMVEMLSFPYSAGPRFVSALLRDGGQGRLDAAFRTPPASTAEILNPDRFLAGVRPAAVAEPAAAGSAFDHGTIGELGLLLMLDGPYRSGRLTHADVEAAAAGLGGDRYVAWSEGADDCVRAHFAPLGPEAAPALDRALAVWSGGRAGVVLEPGPEPVLTSCA